MNYVRVGFGFDSGEVWIWVTFGPTMFESSSFRVTYRYHVWIGTGLVRVEFGSNLFRVVYSNPVRIGHGSSVIWKGGIQFNVWVNIMSSVNQRGYKSSWVNFEPLYVFNVAIFSSLLINCIQKIKTV